MGRKKRRATKRANNPASPPENPSPPRRPQPPPFTSPGTLFLVDINPDLDPDLDPSIKEDCQRALSCLREGNIPRGFTIIQESMSRHPNAVALLRTRAFLHFQTAMVTMTLNIQTRLQHLRDGVAYAEQAFPLCPNLIGLTVIYALSLFKLAKDKVDYENVIGQCQKGLSIQDPVDPEKDLAFYRKETEAEDRISKDARIESAKRELRLLIQRSNEVAMKMEKTSKDEVAAVKKKSAQSVGDDAIWEPFVKSRKSQEQKRLAIEKELDKVRGWQHKVYKGGAVRDEKGTEGYFKRLLSKADRKSLVLQYWKGLSREEQRAFLKVDVSELEGYYIFNESSSLILKEAMGFIRELRSWKFWQCNICGHRFSDGKLWRQHLGLKDHFGKLSLDEAKVLPQEIDAAWVDKIVNGGWRPVDVDRTLKYIVEQANAKQEIGQDVAGESEEKTKDSEMDIDEEEWSYCDDAKRKGMLERICSMFQTFLSNLCLSQSMALRWLQLTRYQLEKKCPIVWELFPYLGKTPLGICFLESEQLEMLYRLTCEIYKNCQMVQPSEDFKFYDEVPNEEEYRETIDYTDDFSCLILDERFLTGEFKPQNSSNVADDENFVYWLYSGAEIGELVKSWTGVKAWKLAIANSSYQFLCTELKLLQSLCKGKSWFSNYERAFHVVRNMCIIENHRRATMPSHEPQKLVQLLCQQRDMHMDIKEGGDLFVCNVITDILHDSSAACFESLASGVVSSGMDTQVPDLRAHEGEGRQRKDRQLLDVELYVLEAIEQKRNDIERKHCIVDGLLMKSLADNERMRQNFGLSSAYDFRAIMLHLLKSFIRGHLENLAEKDAEEKAQAAEKALLTSLALDSNKRKEDEKSTNVGKKSMKKKAFYKRKPKDKVPSKSAEAIELKKKNAEVTFAIASSGGISGSVTTNESTNLEGQLMLTAEISKYEQLMQLIESEGMTLKEMIENQRRIEGQIKQNYLEEQNKEMNETASDNVEDDATLVSSTGEAKEPSVSEPPQHTQAITNPGDSIIFGAFKAPLFPDPRESDVSSNRNLPLPTEAHAEHVETISPAEHQQAEKSGPITLPGTGTADVSDSHPQAGNLGLDDAGNVGREDENAPYLEVGVHNPEVDVFNHPDALTMDQVLPYDRFFNRTNIKRCKVCISFVSEDRGYISA